MITEIGIQEIAQSIVDLVDYAEIVVGINTIQKEIYRTIINNNQLKVFVMLDDTVVGDIKNVKLIGKSGNSLLENLHDIVKDSTKGLLIAFSINIVEVIS